MRWRRLTLLLGLILSSSFSGLLYGQRAGRGIITGLVTDPLGSAVPDATVTVTDEVTQFKTVVNTSSNGNYGTPLLPIGTYSVRVEKPGFKTFLRGGIQLTSGLEYRQDVKLEVGAMTQTSEGKAASDMINVQTADVGHTLNQRYYQDLPVVMGTDIRLAESRLNAQPGFTPMEPNGDPMIAGGGYNSRINGGQASSSESFIDGAAFGYLNGHNGTQESSPPIEAITEMRVDTGSFSAQYGHTSGGFVEYSTKSGTNQFHGSAYEYVGNRALNARSYFDPTVTPFQNNSYGVTAGGPVEIPHLYNGKNSTFFFSNLDLTNLRTGVAVNFDEVVPTMLERSGNFSELIAYGTNPGQKVATDALGRPIYQGEVFDPSTTREVTEGTVDSVTGLTAAATGYVRDGFGYAPSTGLPIAGSANIIPTPDALRSAIAAKVNALTPTPLIAGVGYNALGTASGDPNSKIDPKTWLLRIDHQISTDLKMYTTWYQNSRPAIRNCKGPEGCIAPYTDPADFSKNTDYLYSGTYQRISVRNLHQQFDWVIKPNVFNHTTVAYDRWIMVGISMSNGVGWIQALGLKQSNGSLLPLYGPKGLTGGFPAINYAIDALAPGVADTGGGWNPGFETTNRWQFLDDLSWIQGKHTIKVGGEYRHHQIPQDGWNRGAITGNWQFDQRETSGIDASGNILRGSTGDPYASFLLGQVDNANIVMFQPGTWREAYTAMFINDEIKVTRKLTMTLGLRYDYMFPRTEAHNRYSSFDPTLPDPAAGGILGAMAFAGTCRTCTGKDTFEKPVKNDWGPRLGLAYRMTGKSVIRAGYGMYYAGISLNYTAPGGYPDVGAGATYPTAANYTGGLYPAFYWDVGGTCPAYLTAQGIGCGFPSSDIIPPPDLNPAIADGGNPKGVHPDALNLPRYQNWSFTYERQLTANSSFMLAYLGTRGTRLPMNGQAMGWQDNQMNPAYLSLGSSVLESPITSPAAQSAAPVRALPMFSGIHLPYPGFTGDVGQALRPYPQDQEVIWRSGFPGGASIYHALQTEYERRFSAGLQMRVAYTWSKLINNGAESALIWGAAVQNPVNVAAEKGLSADDVPHVLIVTYTYALPFGKGEHWVHKGGAANQVIGGWHLAGVQRYNSGRPINVTRACETCNFNVGNQQRPDKVGGGGWTGGTFDPAIDRYESSSGWAAPANALSFGNASRTDPELRDFPVYNEDFNLFKEFLIWREAVKLRFETQLGNAFNRHYFCTPGLTWGSGSFGQVTAMCNQPRHIDFGMKLTW